MIKTHKTHKSTKTTHQTTHFTIPSNLPSNLCLHSPLRSSSSLFLILRVWSGDKSSSNCDRVDSYRYLLYDR